MAETLLGRLKENRREYPEVVEYYHLVTKPMEGGFAGKKFDGNVTLMGITAPAIRAIQNDRIKSDEIPKSKGTKDGLWTISQAEEFLRVTGAGLEKRSLRLSTDLNPAEKEKFQTEMRWYSKIAEVAYVDEYFKKPGFNAFPKDLHGPMTELSWHLGPEDAWYVAASVVEEKYNKRFGDFPERTSKNNPYSHLDKATSDNISKGMNQLFADNEKKYGHDRAIILTVDELMDEKREWHKEVTYKGNSRKAEWGNGLETRILLCQFRVRQLHGEPGEAIEFAKAHGFPAEYYANTNIDVDTIYTASAPPTKAVVPASTPTQVATKKPVPASAQKSTIALGSPNDFKQELKVELPEGFGAENLKLGPLLDYLTNVEVREGLSGRYVYEHVKEADGTHIDYKNPQQSKEAVQALRLKGTEDILKTLKDAGVKLDPSIDKVKLANSLQDIALTKGELDVYPVANNRIKSQNQRT